MDGGTCNGPAGPFFQYYAVNLNGLSLKRQVICSTDTGRQHVKQEYQRYHLCHGDQFTLCIVGVNVELVCVWDSVLIAKDRENIFLGLVLTSSTYLSFPRRAWERETKQEQPFLIVPKSRWTKLEPSPVFGTDKHHHELQVYNARFFYPLFLFSAKMGTPIPICLLHFYADKNKFQSVIALL
jgi:hypothetical protein